MQRVVNSIKSSFLVLCHHASPNDFQQFHSRMKSSLLFWVAKIRIIAAIELRKGTAHLPSGQKLMFTYETLITIANAAAVAIGSLGALSSSVILRGSSGKIQRLQAINKAVVSNRGVSAVSTIC